MSEKNTVNSQPLKKLLTPVLLLGLLGGCADSFDQASEEDINSPTAGIMHLGDQMHEQGDDQGAMEFYARVVQRAPDDVQAREKLASLLEAHGDDQDAAAQYKALTKLKPDTIDYHRDYGRTLIKLNKPADAKTQYEAALAIDTSDMKALNGLGIALDLLGNHAAAQEKYKPALTQDPNDLTALNNIGHSYILAGDYDGAIQELEPQYENPKAPPALRENLAEAYGMKDMVVDAERVLRKDLTPDQIKAKLAQYRALRAKTAKPVAFANLGTFSTADLAQARLDKIKAQFASAIGGLNLAVVPEVSEEGGTPIFYARASGFKDPAAAHAFCATLKKDGALCTEHEG